MEGRGKGGLQGGRREGVLARLLAVLSEGVPGECGGAGRVRGRDAVVAGMKMGWAERDGTTTVWLGRRHRHEACYLLV